MEISYGDVNTWRSNCFAVATDGNSYWTSILNQSNSNTFKSKVRCIGKLLLETLEQQIFLSSIEQNWNAQRIKKIKLE